MSSEWITGKALETVIALRGFEKGDELKCISCTELHLFSGWPELDISNRAVYVRKTNGQSLGLMAYADITRWRPKQR